MFYIPKKTPRAAALISAASYALGAALFIAAEFLKPRLGYQLLALVFAAVGIFFTARYILTDYKYVLTEVDRKGAEANFSVIKLSGRRETPVASFDVRDIYAIEKCSKNSDFEAKHGKVNKIYSYVSNFASKDVYKVAVEFNGMKVLLSVELSEDFAEAIGLLLRVKNDKNEENGL
jgi:hypothetical protein